MAIPDSDVTVQFAAGKAEMHVSNLTLDDYHFLANAIGPNFENPATEDDAVVSFDVVWSAPITRRLDVPNGTLGNNYSGEFVENQVTVSWSGTNLATGFTFTSNPGTFATSFFDGGFAELGHEGNGIFDPGSSDDAAVARALVASPATPASTASSLPPSRLAAGPIATSAITVPTAQNAAPGPTAPQAGAAQASVVDQLVAILGGSTAEPF